MTCVGLEGVTAMQTGSQNARQGQLACLTPALLSSLPACNPTPTAAGSAPHRNSPACLGQQHVGGGMPQVEQQHGVGQVTPACKGVNRSQQAVLKVAAVDPSMPSSVPANPGHPQHRSRSYWPVKEVVMLARPAVEHPAQQQQHARLHGVQSVEGPGPGRSSSRLRGTTYSQVTAGGACCQVCCRGRQADSSIKPGMAAAMQWAAAGMITGNSTQRALTAGSGPASRRPQPC